MNEARYDSMSADALESADEADAGITAWELDELDPYSDLDSVRWAMDRDDA